MIFKILLCKSLLLLVSSCYAKPFNAITQFAQKAHKKPAFWHIQKAKSTPERFHDRFENFLILFLDACKTIHTQEQLAQAIMALSLIKQYQPKIFQHYQLANLLDECFKQAQSFTPTASMTLFELQPYFDYWYFSKISHNSTYQELFPAILKSVLNSSVCATITDPVAALVMVNYLTILKTCNVKLYKRHKKQIPLLKKVIKKDTITHGYLLVCQFFYQNLKELDCSYFEELAHYCSKISLEKVPLDLVAQLYACYKLTNQLETSTVKNLAALLNKQQPQSFEEICALTLAACS